MGFSTIKPEGFAAVKMDALLRMAGIKELTDVDMVRQQRAAMIDPNAPNPSVEAILMPSSLSPMWTIPTQTRL